MITSILHFTPLQLYHFHVHCVTCDNPKQGRCASYDNACGYRERFRCGISNLGQTLLNLWNGDFLLSDPSQKTDLQNRYFDVIAPLAWKRSSDGRIHEQNWGPKSHDRTSKQPFVRCACQAIFRSGSIQNRTLNSWFYVPCQKIYDSLSCLDGNAPRTQVPPLFPNWRKKVTSVWGC